MSETTNCKQVEFEILIDTFVENTNLDKHLSTFVSYGTAGFRGHADKIRPLVRRIGVCAGLRSFVTNENTGVMVTASHNPIQDNGVKIIDGSGQMLSPKWESFFEKYVNNPAVTSNDELLRKIKDLARDNCKFRGRVIIGRDTRPTSEDFVSLLKEGLAETLQNSRQVECLDLGVVTTPALHYLVGEAAREFKENDVKAQHYYEKLLINGFVELNQSNLSQTNPRLYDSSALVVDCANGVGQKTMQYLLGNAKFKRYLPAELINFSSKPNDVLNHECGADYVKTKQLPPRGANQLNKRYASLDGDADRLVYFFLQDETNESGGDIGNLRQLRLLDGDKILCLFVKYLTDMLKKYNLIDQLSLGAVQTAYANGASTDFLRQQLGVVNIDCTDTGVKNLHKKALDYDLGIYFEANGHGTIHVSGKARSLFQERQVTELQQLLSILNDYTGDAVSDILIAETILWHYDWDIKQWYGMYHDRPNSLIKVEVRDRNVVKTTNADRTCLEPRGLQDFINNLVSEFGPSSRSFVRASGTENVVRVYAEAKDQESADQLSKLVGERVIEICNIN